MYILLIFISLISAFIGWFTNWLAVQMVFNPINFLGIQIKKPFLINIGWQGVIPKHSIKMSRHISNIFKEKIKPSELYYKIEIREIINILKNIIEEKSNEILEIVFKKYNQTLWNLLPDIFKDNLKNEIKQKIEKHIKKLYNEYGKVIDDIFDFEVVVKDSLTGNNIQNIIEVFKRTGNKEFEFIVKSGFWFGLLIGLVQFIFYDLFSKWWIMPISGIAIGYITNWLALEMIFKPLEPKKYLFFYYQGLFLKRQSEVSWELAEILDKRIFSSDNYIRLFFQDKAGEKFKELLVKQTQNGYNEFIKEKGIIFSFIFSEDQKIKIEKEIIDLILNSLPKIFETIKDYIKTTVGMKEIIGTRLSFLPPKEFENLLHSVFKEEELLLILIGAVLGGLIGFGQAFYFLI